jgi:hypothetical protein
MKVDIAAVWPTAGTMPPVNHIGHHASNVRQVSKLATGIAPEGADIWPDDPILCEHRRLRPGT